MDSEAKGKPIIFVSCGQATEEERRLGREIARLVDELTPYEGYFAENQSNLSGLTENVFRELDQATGLIAVMQPRGEVRRDAVGEPPIVRGSVWIEQEIAIAAFREHLLRRPLPVIACIHRSIEREGVRQVLMLNPIPFSDDAEVLAELHRRLPGWRPLPLPTFPIRVRLKGRQVSRSDNRREFEIEVELKNRTEATEVRQYRVDLFFPRPLIESPDSHSLHRVLERETEQHLVFRITEKSHLSEPLYPKTPKTIFKTQYVISEPEITGQGPLLDEQVIAEIYALDQKDTVTRTVRQVSGL